MMGRCVVPALDDSVFAHDPPVLERRDILYVPRSRRYPDPDFGLFSETGRQLLESATFEAYPTRIKCQRVATTLRRTAAFDDIDRAVYGGVIASHYGHFLTECLNTLWYARQADGRSRTYIFHSPMTVTEVFSTPWIADLLSFAGITADQVVIPRFPTIIRHATIPGPAFCEDAFAYRIYGAFGRAIGETASRRAHLPRSSPVFLARSRLRNGTTAIENEAEVHDALARRGVEIVYPEDLTIGEQIGVHRDSPAIGGFVGSAFHTSIFADGATGTVLTLDASVRRSFHLMDAVSHARFQYISVPDHLELPVPGGFFRRVSLAYPDAVADAVLRGFDATAERGTARIASDATRLRQGFTSRTEDAVRLRSFGDNHLVTSRTTGRLHAVASIPVDGEDLPVLLLRDGRRGLLAAAEAPVLSVDDDELVSPFLPYEVLQGNRPGTIALRNPENGRFLSAPPAPFNRHCFNDVSQVGDWESFALQRPSDRFEPDGRWSAWLEDLRCVETPGAERRRQNAARATPIERTLARLARIDRDGADRPQGRS